MVRDGQAPGSAGLHLAGGAVLRPEEQVLGAMLEGWRAEQLARNLAFSTIGQRLTAVAAFTRHADAPPWLWTAQMACPVRLESCGPTAERLAISPDSACGESPGWYCCLVVRYLASGLAWVPRRMAAPVQTGRGIR